MRIPNPYFKNVPDVGDLRLEKIIVNYDYPILSVLTDNQNRRYLCLCFDIEESQQWLITYISTEDLIKILTNKITLSEPFRNPSSNKIYATYNYDTKLDSYIKVSADKVLSEDLPATGEFLDSEQDEWNDYISIIRDAFYSTTTRRIYVSQIAKHMVVSIQRNTSKRKVTTWNSLSGTRYDQERVLCLN